MRILLCFICCKDDDLKDFLLYGYVCVIFSLIRILLSFTCYNDFFLINEFKCAWGFDGGFWQIEWWCFSDVFWVCVKCVLSDCRHDFVIVVVNGVKCVSCLQQQLLALKQNPSRKDWFGQRLILLGTKVKKKMTKTLRLYNDILYT